MGRYPNASASNGGYLTYTQHSGTYSGVTDPTIAGNPASITDTTLPDSTNWTGAQLVVRKDHWILDRATITNQAAGVISYVSPTNYVPFNNFGYFIQNDIRTLDQNGEWYYNPTTKKFDIYYSSDPSGLVQVSTIDTLITAHSVNNIAINGIDLSGANVNAIDLDGNQSVQMNNIAISFSGEDGIIGHRAIDMSLTNSSIENSNDSAINCYYGCTGAVITGNDIENSGMIPGMGQSGTSTYLGMLVVGDNSLIKNNTVRNSGYMAIRFSGDNAVVQGNVVDQFESVKDDGGGIYTAQGSGALKKIIGNFISNGVGAPNGAVPSYYCSQQFANHGIYLDYGTNNVEISGNTVTNTGGGLFIYNSYDITAQNNNFINDAIGILIQKSPQSADLIRNNDITNNAFVSSQDNQDALCLMSSQSDPTDVTLFGTIDQNNYVRPGNTTAGFAVLTSANPAGTTFSFSDWQKKYPYDNASQLDDIANALFPANPSGGVQTVSLAGPYIDDSGNTYSGSVNIPAYSSLVLLKNNTIAPTPTSTNTSSGNTSSVGIVTPINPTVTTPPIVSVASVAPTPPPIVSIATSVANAITNFIPSIITGTWSFIPSTVQKSAPAAEKPSSNVVVPQPPDSDKKSYTIVSADYLLNGVLVHTAKPFPDNWTIDTSTLQDGSYTLVTIFHYADTTTDSNSSTFTVDNTPSVIEQIVQFFQSFVKKV